MQLTPDGPIALIGTLDTKGGEVRFLNEHLESLGLQTLVVDIGIAGVPLFEPDVKREEIALRGGSSIEALIAGRDRGSAVVIMQSGLSNWMRELFWPAWYLRCSWDWWLGWYEHRGDRHAAVAAQYPELIVSRSHRATHARTSAHRT